MFWRFTWFLWRRSFLHNSTVHPIPLRLLAIVVVLPFWTKPIPQRLLHQPVSQPASQPTIVGYLLSQRNRSSWHSFRPPATTSGPIRSDVFLFHHCRVLPFLTKSFSQAFIILAGGRPSVSSFLSGQNHSPNSSFVHSSALSSLLPFQQNHSLHSSSHTNRTNTTSFHISTSFIIHHTSYIIHIHINTYTHRTKYPN